MTTETKILTDEQIAALRNDTRPNSWAKSPGSIEKFARAIEQAVLQSPEVKRLREALGWQSIQTGPRDGTRVILAWGGESINGFFLDNSGTSRPWTGWRTESMVPAPAGQPTHWMPLPPPPQHDNE